MNMHAFSPVGHNGEYIDCDTPWLLEADCHGPARVARAGDPAALEHARQFVVAGHCLPFNLVPCLSNVLADLSVPFRGKTAAQSLGQTA